MGNEMGNNNTSGLKEDDNTNVEDPKVLSKDTSGVDDVKEVNHIVPAAQDKDFHEKANGLASNDPERVVADKQTPNRGEQEETVVFVLDDSPEVTAGSDEAGGGSSENQQLSLSNDAENESLIDPNIEEIAPESNENQLQRQASIKKEVDGVENSAFDPISTPSHDLEPQKLAQSDGNQHELATIHAELSVPDDSGSYGETEEVLGSSLKCVSLDNGHLSEAEEPENQEAVVDTEPDTVTEKQIFDSLVEQKASQEEKKAFEDKFEPEVEDKIDDASRDVTTPLTVLSGLAEEGGTGFSTEVSLVKDHSSEAEPESEPETISVTNSPNSHQEVLETEDKCMILTEETRLIGEELKNGEDKPDYSPTEASEDLVKESDTEDSNAFQSESITLEQKEAVKPYSESKSSEDCRSEEAKAAENDEALVACISNCKETRQESEGNIVVTPELAIIPLEPNTADCDDKDEESTEKRIVEAREENAEHLYATVIETEETKTREEILLLVHQSQAVLTPQPSLSSIQADHQQESVLRSETVQYDNQSIQELNQDSCGEFLTTKASNFDSTNIIADISVSMNELTVDRTKQEVKKCIEMPEVKAAETKTSSKGFAEQSSKNEISRESVGRLSIGSLERLSTDSDPDNSNIHSQMRKSPSFNIDLQNEESESDQTPLLYQDKAPIQSSPSQDDVSLGDPLRLNGYDPVLTQYQAMPLPLPVEEKVVKLERSDSEKSKTPFLGFLKEEEEAHVVVTPQKHSRNGFASQKETKDLWKSSSREATSSTSPKAKEKRKARSSLFGNCMCCATVIN
ncbi:hypothetical protein TorRG33x02_018450 [Trema orientale]|uniref:Uncharacterized protein n=1 Tax=Trema orientale TaxID=63057 RepID=A0A2P5FW76_TREOI|nr:hypothetical protein TorRG33x02_018450 [Trema orientale]